jgi:hypothetical protein
VSGSCLRNPKSASRPLSAPRDTETLDERDLRLDVV